MTLSLQPLFGSAQHHALRQLTTFFPEEHHYRLYLVGGAVRDLLMGRTPNDLDVEIFGIDEAAFDRSLRSLGAVSVGRSFHVYKWQGIDIALPRIETKTAPGHQGFTTTLCHDEREASLRRDFTINALMLNLHTGELLDFHGGQDDIHRRQLRIVSPKRFAEDSLRVLRAMQFSARLGFKISDEDCALMRTISLDDLTSERIAWEFEKMFSGSHLHYGLYYLLRLNIAERVLGVSFPPRRFFQAAMELQHTRNKVEPPLLPYLFLFIFGRHAGVTPSTLCNTITLPKHYARFLQQQKNPPHNGTDRFLRALAIRYPLRQWLGHAYDNYKKRAQVLDIYEQPFTGGITPQQLLDAGYQGKALGDELRRRRLHAARTGVQLTESNKRS